MDAYIEAFECNGRKDANAVINKHRKGNYKGYRDHFSMVNKTEASREYYEYINQLKSVFNPSAVQKHVDAERKKNLQAAKAQKQHLEIISRKIYEIYNINTINGAFI